MEDAGDVYRSLVGLPQGMSSPLAASLRQVAQAAAEGVAGLNALRGAGLRLVAGRGGDQDNAEDPPEPSAAAMREVDVVG